MSFYSLQAFPDGGFSLGILALALVLVTVVQSLEFVDGYETRALTVLGEYRGLLEPGVHVVPPFVSGTRSFDMRTQTLEVADPDATTGDGVSVTVDAALAIRVEDAEAAFLEVENYRQAVEELARDALERAVDEVTLDELRDEPDRLSDRLERELGESTGEWGVRVEGVDVHEVTAVEGEPGAD